MPLWEPSLLWPFLGLAFDHFTTTITTTISLIGTTTLGINIIISNSHKVLILVPLIKHLCARRSMKHWCFIWCTHGRFWDLGPSGVVGLSQGLALSFPIQCWQQPVLMMSTEMMIMDDGKKCQPHGRYWTRYLVSLLPFICSQTLWSRHYRGPHFTEKEA